MQRFIQEVPRGVTAGTRKISLHTHHFSFTCGGFATSHCHEWKLAQSNCSEASMKVNDCNILQNGKHIKSHAVKISMKKMYSMNILEECITQSA